MDCACFVCELVPDREVHGRMQKWCGAKVVEAIIPIRPCDRSGSDRIAALSDPGIPSAITYPIQSEDLCFLCERTTSWYSMRFHTPGKFYSALPIEKIGIKMDVPSSRLCIVLSTIIEHIGISLAVSGIVPIRWRCLFENSQKR